MNRTALYDTHLAMGAKMVEFAGWEMPVRYTDIRQEHLAVRSGAGVFDISHMGEIEVEGPDAGRYCQWLTTNDIRGITDGQAQYTLLCMEHGGVVDDIIVSRVSGGHFFICVNSSNTQKDFAWFEGHTPGFDVTVRDASPLYSQIAIQGPHSPRVLEDVLGTELGGLRTFHFMHVQWKSMELLVSRTGYTGEDGFEVFLPWDGAVGLWDEIISRGVTPCGLGARDTLRVEKAYPLYGHEIDEHTNPLEAGLGRFVRLEGDDFIGRASLIAASEAGLQKSLCGFVMVDRGVPREGYEVYVDGVNAGRVTSGTMSPSLGKAIGLCFIKAGIRISRGEIEIEIHDSLRKARVVPLPILKKRRQGE